MAIIPNQKELRERKLKQITRQRNHYQPIPSIGQIMQDREKKKEENKQQGAKRISSIELQLPLVVDKLNIGPDKWRTAKRNRYLKLLRDGEVTVDEMLMIAEMANRKGVRNPAYWFASVMGRAKWSRTLAFIKKCRKVIQTAGEVARRLGTSVSGSIIKQTWRHPKVLQYAIQAQELASNRLKYFVWLCTHSEAL